MNTAINIKQEALKNGLIWAAINIVIFLFTWYMFPSALASTTYSILQALLGIVLASFFCLDLRKKNGGYWSFGEALWPIFAMFVMSMGVVYVFNILFGKIDPSYPQKMSEMVMSTTEETLNKLGLTGDQLDEAMKATADNLEKQFSPTFLQAIKGFGISSIFYFLGALIFALIFKKTNNNPFINEAEDNIASKEN